MRRKEALFAVIGGVVGAVLTMAAGLFSPLGAQDEDASFGTVTCQELKVVGPAGDTRVWLLSEFDGGLYVFGGDGKIRARMVVDISGGLVNVSSNDGKIRALMGAVKHGGEVRVTGKHEKKGAKMGMDEHGGMVAVSGKAGRDPKAVMGVNEYGDGALSTWDKNGYRLK